MQDSEDEGDELQDDGEPEDIQDSLHEMVTAECDSGDLPPQHAEADSAPAASSAAAASESNIVTVNEDADMADVKDPVDSVQKETYKGMCLIGFCCGKWN